MKKINRYILLTVLAASVTFTGCKKWIDEDLNIDPNNPSDVPMNIILPGCEASLAYTYGSDLSRYPSLWIQTFAGISNQHLLYDNYVLNESDVNNMWQFNLYAGAMPDINNLINKATAANSPHYRGVARILMANALGSCTDLWGDIPYSEAFQGLDNLRPKFDSQQEIYTSIMGLLDGAIADLAEANSTFAPSTDDFIYGGDLSLWTKFAYSLKARYKIHLIKRDPGAAAAALAAIDAGAIADVSETAKLTFGALSNEQNPFYQFYSNDRPGDAGIGKNIVDIMNAISDPRMAVYFADDGSGTYTGSTAGSGEPSNDLGPFYNNPTGPVFFMTYAEVKFIEAEAAFRTGDNARAATAYNDAIAASLAEYGITDAAFLTANASEDATSITIEKIFTQKYIHMFAQGTEGFTDWRRSKDSNNPNGVPALSPAVNNTTNGVIPRRLPYPNSERLNNGANVSQAAANQGGAAITNKVWWDN